MANPQQITVDLVPEYTQGVIRIKQGDVDSRNVEIYITDQGVTVSFTTGTEAYLAMKKADNTQIYNKVNLYSGHVVSFALSEQCATVPGVHEAEIRFKYNKTWIASATFLIEVASGAYDDSLPPSASEWGVLNEMIVHVDDSRARVEQSEKDVTQLVDDCQEIITDGRAVITDTTQAAADARKAAETANTAARSVQMPIEQANTAADNANQKAQDAQSAASWANECADEALTASERANVTASKAETATTNANTATTAAQDATQKAQAAATTANNTVATVNTALTAVTDAAGKFVHKQDNKSFAMSGNPIETDMAADSVLKGCVLHGGTSVQYFDDMYPFWDVAKQIAAFKPTHKIESLDGKPCLYFNSYSAREFGDFWTGAFKKNTVYTFGFKARPQAYTEGTTNRALTFDLYYTDGTTTRLTIAAEKAKNDFIYSEIASSSNKTINFVRLSYEITYNWIIDIESFKVSPGMYAEQTKEISPDKPCTITGQAAEVQSRGANLLPLQESSITVNGVTVTIAADGLVTINGAVSAGYPWVKLSGTIGSTTATPYAAGNPDWFAPALLSKDNYSLTKSVVSGAFTGTGGMLQVCDTSGVVSPATLGRDIASVAVYLGASGAEYSNYKFYVMLNQGTKTLPYTPYQAATITYNQELLDGDYMDLTTGKIVRKWKKYRVDGGADWNTAGGSTTEYITYWRSLTGHTSLNSAYTNFMSTHFSPSSKSIWSNPTGYFGGVGATDRAVYISVKKTDAATPAEMKTWCKNHPFDIYVEPLEKVEQDTPAVIPTYAGYTHLTCPGDNPAAMDAVFDLHPDYMVSRIDLDRNYGVHNTASGTAVSLDDCGDRFMSAAKLKGKTVESVFLPVAKKCLQKYPSLSSIQLIDGRLCFTSRTAVMYQSLTDHKIFSGVFKAGTQYTLSLEAKTITSAGKADEIYLGWDYTDGTQGGAVGLGSSDAFKRIEMKSDAAKQVASLRVSYKLNENTIAVDIESFKITPDIKSPDAPAEFWDSDSPTLTIAGETDSQSIPCPYLLRSVPTGAADEADLVNGTYTQNIESFELKSSMAWKKPSETTDTFSTTDIKPYTTESAACTHFAYRLSYAYIDGCFFLNRGVPSVYFTKTGITSVDDWKAWLDAEKAAGRPVILCYQLATPIVTQIPNYYPRTYKANTKINTEQGNPVEVTYSVDGDIIATSAEATLSSLNTAIDTAETSKTQLQTVINSADTTKGQLSTVITNANTAKTSLDASVTTANGVLQSLTAENISAASNLKQMQSENFNSQEILTGVADIRAYLGLSNDDTIGVQVDYKNKTFKRIAGAANLTGGADFDSYLMFGGRKRCNVADDGTINAYYGDDGYTEDGSNGQVMVYQPKFYYLVCPIVYDPIKTGIGYHLRKANYYVSTRAKAGFKVHPAFIDANGNEVNYILLSAYEGSLWDADGGATGNGAYILDDAQVMSQTTDKFCSIAGAKPASGLTQNLTRPNIEQMAQNRGAGWHGDLIKAASANQLLMIIEMGTMNLQAAIGQGVVSIAENSAYNCSSLTGSTAPLGNATGSATSTINEIGGTQTTETAAGKVSVTYRGMENPWGNIWKFVYGINLYGNGSMGGGQPFICSDFAFAESKNTDNYVGAGFTIANTSGYISAMGYSASCDWLLIPSEALGNGNLPVGDYAYATPDLNGYRVAILGGRWNAGGFAGGFSWFALNGAGTRAWYFGGRLVYVPTA